MAIFCLSSEDKGNMTTNISASVRNVIEQLVSFM